MAMDEALVLSGLNPAQHAAVTSEAAPLCILAGAGSGKTRVLTRRIAHRVERGSADPRHVLALTFTRRAAGELGSRLAALGIRERLVAGTFHSVAYAGLRQRWADRGERAPALLERKVSLVARLMPDGHDPALQPGDLAAEIEWAKARMVAPKSYAAEAIAAGRRPPLPAPAMAEVYSRYEEEKRRRALVDFDDLLLLAVRALENDRGFAASQRWRFRHLFVDEFQDLNPVQFRLLEGWRGASPDLCVVGDPNQAIYSWNGADAGYLTGFCRHFPGAEVLRLDDNYRSSPQVLAVAGAVLGDASRPTSPLRANCPDGPVPTVTSHADDRTEAHHVARQLRARHGAATPWSHQAVLARTNAQLALFEQALRALQIPYRVRGGRRFLDDPTVRAALADVGRTRSAPVAAAVGDLQQLAAAHPDEAGSPSEGRALLDELVRLARDYATLDPSGKVEGLLSWLRATVGGDDTHRSHDVVELATFHAAKGLEWPVVHIVGLERGLVPIGHAESPAARAEERRLLYVAMTRAERELHCSWAERRTLGTRTVGRSASPCLAEVEAALAGLAQEGDPDWRRHLHDQRQRLRGGGTSGAGRIEVGRNADPVVLDALRSWRRRAAQASGVPAFVIFHDTTLAAMAEAKPCDRAALLAVPGMGTVKAERYGEQLLAVVAAHAAHAS